MLESGGIEQNEGAGKKTRTGGRDEKITQSWRWEETNLHANYKMLGTLVGNKGNKTLQRWPARPGGDGRINRKKERRESGNEEVRRGGLSM